MRIVISRNIASAIISYDRTDESSSVAPAAQENTVCYAIFPEDRYFIMSLTAKKDESSDDESKEGLQNFTQTHDKIHLRQIDVEFAKWAHTESVTNMSFNWWIDIKVNGAESSEQQKKNENTITMGCNLTKFAVLNPPVRGSNHCI